jgi:hypothetical protein
MNIMQRIQATYAQTRGTLEKWLQYPRYLQQEYGVNPVLAGGCIRDLLLGQEPKDLDLFISMSEWRWARDSDTIQEIFDVIAHREGWALDGEEHVAPIPASLVSVYHHKERDLEYPYQIAVLREDTPAAELIGQFDFGINMVGVNTYGALALTEYFVYDAEHHTITIRNERSRETTLARYERLSKKYPGPLMTAEGLELEKPLGGLVLPENMK